MEKASFITTTKGKITAAGASVLATVAAWYGIAQTQVGAIKEEGLAKIYDSISGGVYTRDQVDTILYNFAHSGEENLVEIANKYYAQMDQVIADASIDALTTPTTLAGTAAVACVCAGAVYLLHRKAKKAQQMCDKEVDA